jgi:hypothetical protein
MAVGLCAWAFAVSCFIWVGVSGRQSDDPYLIGGAISSVALFGIGLAALFIAAAFKNVALPVAHIDDEQVWIAGADPDVLASLPEWTGPSFQQLRASRGF